MPIPMQAGEIVVNQVADKSVLSTLVSGAISGVGGFIAQEVMREVTKRIFDEVDLEEIKSVLGQIIDQLEQMQATQQEILDKIDYIRVAIEKRIVEEHLKDAFSEVYGLSDQVNSFLNDIKDGKYNEKSRLLKENYSSLAARVQETIPVAVTRISQSDHDLLDLLREQNLKDKTDIFNYSLSLSFALSKLWAVYRLAIDLLQFAERKYVFLDGIVGNVNGYVVRLGEWKDVYVIGAITPLVSSLLNESTKSYTIGGKVLSRKRDNAHILPQYGVGIYGDPPFIIVTTADTIRSMVIMKAEDFSLERPLLRFKFESGGGFWGPVGASNLAAISRSEGTVLTSINYPDKSDVWKLVFCENSVIPDKEIANYFCFFNIYYKKYALDNFYVVLEDFSESKSSMFWTVKS